MSDPAAQTIVLSPEDRELLAAIVDRLDRLAVALERLEDIVVIIERKNR